MKPWIAALALVSTATLASESQFAGTRWHLRAIQSMDDAQGTKTIDDPDRFTLHFQADGQAVLRLDCNRATAPYESKASADKTSGTLRFGPVAATQALCPPPHLDERVARDLNAVRGYLLKNDRLYLSLMADGGIYEWAPTLIAGTALDRDRRARDIEFAKGRSAIELRGSVQGYQYIDYRLRAFAGQRLSLGLQGSNPGTTFNLLPPGSIAEGMAVGELSNNRYLGTLPDDGVYTVRVYLPRSAGRRGESSRFRLSVAVSGTPLKALSARVDAVHPGTRFHASSIAPCKPPFVEATQCEAQVVRRGFDGTATVLMRWGDGQVRRILFVKGEAVASDAQKPLKSTRTGDGWRVEFDGGESYQVPEPLVMGG